jgi:hypothetical protein
MRVTRYTGHDKRVIGMSITAINNTDCSDCNSGQGFVWIADCSECQGTDLTPCPIAELS